MKLLLIFVAIVASAVAFEDVTVFEYISAHSEFSTLVSMFSQAHIDSVLNGAGPYTVFAPTNSAFRRMDQSTLAGIQADAAQARRLLNYHVVKEYLMIPLISGFSPHKTLEGSDVTLHHITGGLLVNNGTRVLHPNDIICNNGVIQPIDSVLFPPVHMDNLNIAQHLIMDERFRDFTLALMLTNLLVPLEQGEFTVFASINTGFAGLARIFTDPDTPKASIDQAIEIYKYHIVPGRRTKAMLHARQPLYTLHSTALNVSENARGEIMVNYATVTGEGINASNGIIYPIDLMLAPMDIVRAMMAQAGINATAIDP